jgi:hypothetical protein
VTTILAVWGAVVSTIAIIWNIRRDLADRGKLRVVCSERHTHAAQYGYRLLRELGLGS